VVGGCKESSIVVGVLLGVVSVAVDGVAVDGVAVDRTAADEIVVDAAGKGRRLSWIGLFAGAVNS
jgi:hypothetical protein